MNEHSLRGASSAERWMNCPGSVALLRRLDLPPQDDPEYRRAGTAAHAVLASCLRTSGAEEPLDAWELIGATYEGVRVDEAMANAVQVALDECRCLASSPHAEIYIEKKLHSPLHADFWGTVDFAVVADSLLNIVDFKYGEGIAVEVENNPQLKYYAWLILERHPDVRRVVLRIVQPRAIHPDGPIRRWETTAEDIGLWVETELVPAMREEADSLLPGEWCRFCPAKLICPALSSLFEAAANADPKKVIALGDDMLGRAWALRKAVKSYLKALEDEILRRLMKGGTVPLAKLVEKRADRVFQDEAGVIFVARFGGDAYEPQRLKSPAQMENLGTEAKKLVREYAYTPKTGLTVADADDKRLAVRPETAAEAFAASVRQLEEG
jgi:hypothetical protein